MSHDFLHAEHMRNMIHSLRTESVLHC